MEWAFNNLSETLLIIGIVLLIIEILVLGFSTFVLFFIGIAAVITSGLIYIGILPETIISALFSLGILTGLSAGLLWKPLKDSQNKTDTTKAQGDLVGHSFVLTEPVSDSENPLYRYSGIDWKLTSTTPIAAGSKVQVIQADVGTLTVEEQTSE